MATDGAAGSFLESFAKANGLSYSNSTELPAESGMLGHGGSIEAAAAGALPGGATGTIVHYTYTTTDSDNHTTTHHRTVAWTRVPESVGFAPYLSSAIYRVEKVKRVKLDNDFTVLAFDGMSESWLRQLFSPSLLDYISRSPRDEGFELSSGLLSVERDNHLTDRNELSSLCADLAHLADAIRRESMEEVESGGAEETAAKDPSADDPGMEAALAAVKLSSSPTSVASAKPEFRRHVMAGPGQWIRALGVAAAITLAVNIPAAAIPILLAVDKVWAPPHRLRGADLPGRRMLRDPRAISQRVDEVRAGGVLSRLRGGPPAEADSPAFVQRHARRIRPGFQARSCLRGGASGRRQRCSRCIRRRHRPGEPHRDRRRPEGPRGVRRASLLSGRPLGQGPRRLLHASQHRARRLWLGRGSVPNQRVGACAGAGRDQPPESGPPVRHEAVGALRQPRRAPGQRGERGGAGKDLEKRRKGGSRREDVAIRCGEMPGLQPIAGRHRAQQALRLGRLDLDRHQPALAIPAQYPAQRPAAKAAVGVEEDRGSRGYPRLLRLRRSPRWRGALGAEASGSTSRAVPSIGASTAGSPGRGQGTATPASQAGGRPLGNLLR